MKRWMIFAGGGVLLVIVGVVVWLNMGSKPPPRKVEERPTGPDPSYLAKVAALVKDAEDMEAQGRYVDALRVLGQLAKLEPGHPQLAVLKPRVEEKLRRYEAWNGAHQKADSERKDATRRNTIAAWQKVLDLSGEAEKNAPGEEQRKLSHEIALFARQYHGWASAREEERKGNWAAAFELVVQAITVKEPPPELAAYKTALENKKLKQEFDRAAAVARAEVVPAKAYELWVKVRPLATDPKDIADVEAKIDALKPFADPAERDRRFDAAMKAGEESLKAGDFDKAEKSFKDAKALKVTDTKPAQALSRLATARTQKGYETALAEARAAEEKKEWADAIEAYDRAIRTKPGDSSIVARRKEIEDNYRSPKITLMLNEQIGVKMEFVLIKRGKFMMGDASGDSDETPHEVVIPKDFWMQTTELTQAHWDVVMHTRPWVSSSIPHMPVEGVTWEDAMKFFEKLNLTVPDQLKGRRAALPTEAQWEYACRAGTTTKWSFGNDEAQLDNYGWFARSGVKGPQTVGQKRPNPWGLYDMHGNVAEWVADGYGPYDKGPGDDFKTFRGGSWNDRAAITRSSKREKDLISKSNMFIGFRAVIR